MMIYGFKNIVIFSGVLLYSINLYSQSLSDTILIKEVTITGDRFFKKEEAGLKTTRVDSMVLIDKINVSLSDILSENTTVFIKDFGRGALATASFRGTAPSHTQVFWNGIMINSPMLGMTDFSVIPAFIIDDLNLNHGAASLSTSSGGLGGSISIQSTPVWENSLSWRYFQGVGSYSTYDEFFQLNAGNSRIQSKTRLYHNFSENNYEYINKAISERPIVKNENADYLKKGFSQELYFRSGNSNIFTLKAWGQISNRSLPSVMSYEGDNHSNINSQVDTTLKFSADWIYYKERVKITTRSGIDYQQTGYNLLNNIRGVGMVPAINSASKAFSWYNYLSFENEIAKHFSYKASCDFNRFDVETYEAVREAGYSKVRNDISLFAGFYYNMSEYLNLSLMLRQELTGNLISPLMFDMGASFKPLKNKGIIIKANFSRNYHHPSLNDLFWQPGGNPDLLPEESYTGEMSVEYSIKVGKMKIEQVLTPYYSDISDWIIWLPSFQGYWQPFNLKKVKSYGLEYHLKFIQKVGGFDFHVNGNYAITKSLNYGERLFLGDGSYGKQLPFIPVQSGNLLFSVSYKGYFLRLQNNSYSELFTLSSNEIGMTDDSQNIGAGISTSKMNWYYPYFMNSLSTGKDFILKKYNVGFDFKINNLFNENYRSVLGRYMPGRNYEIILKISYNK